MITLKIWRNCKMTRKKILIPFSIVIAVIIIAVSIVMLGNTKGKEDAPAVKSEKVDFILGDEYLYDIAIEYIKNETNEEMKTRNEEGYPVFCDYHGFGIAQKGNQKYVYMWILTEVYRSRTDIVYGKSMPYKFTFENDEVVCYEVPQDGTGYSKSIEKIFPEEIVNQIFEFRLEKTTLQPEAEEYFSSLNNDINTSSATMKAVIIRAEDDYLGIMELGNQNSLLRLSLNSFNYDGFKTGQEILIYYDGFVLESFPGQINNIEKIEIINEESNVQIPDEYFRVFYNSGENVEVSVSKITNNGIDLLIKDTNDLQYVYSNHYMIQKQVKNPNYTGVVQTLGENTSNSIAPAMRNRTRIYL